MENNTSIVINLAERYAAAFGYFLAEKAISAAVVTKEDKNYSVDYFDDFDPITEEVRFRYINERTLSMFSVGIGAGIVTAPYEELRFFSMLHGDASNIFAPPLMLDFSREKNLIETETNGEDNVIVERWGTKPWEIDIRGILIDVENRQYPTDQVRKLHQLFKHNNVIEVVGVLFEEKDIDNIYLKDVSINPIEGFPDTVQFSFSASSIKEVTWNLLKPNQ